MRRRRDRKPAHPGEILRREFLDRLELAPEVLADDLGLPDAATDGRRLIQDLLAGRAAITAALAAKLAIRFGTSAEFWLDCQSAWERGR